MSKIQGRKEVQEAVLIAALSALVGKLIDIAVEAVKARLEKRKGQADG
jgi:hypothetical protein